MKLASLVGSGGEAKHLIQAGEVFVNGVVEKHRSKKLRQGDQVTFQRRSLTVKLGDRP